MTRTFAVLGALLAAGAARAEVGYEVEAGVGTSDNVTRTQDPEGSESLASLGLNLDWRENTRRLQSEVVTDLSYVEYLDNTYEGEVLGTADANFVFGIVPETFTWQLHDSFGQARGNPFEPVTPENRENVNYLSTGPDVRFRFGSQTMLLLYGRYTATDYEESDLDGDRTSVGAGLFRDLSAASRVGVNAVVDETGFDNELTPDFERRSAYLSYDHLVGRTRASAQVGYSTIEVDGQESDGGALVNLNLTRDLTEASSIELIASRQFTDAGEALAGGGLGGVGSPGGGLGGGLGGGGSSGGGDLTASSAPFEGRQYSLAWNFSKRRTRAQLGVSFNEALYETTPLLDRKTQAIFGMVSRQLRPTLSVQLDVEYLEEEFATADFDTEELQTSLQLTWQMTRHLGLRLSGDRYDHSTSTGLGEFVENRVFLYLTWSGGTSAPATR